MPQAVASAGNLFLYKPEFIGHYRPGRTLARAAASGTFSLFLDLFERARSGLHAGADLIFRNRPAHTDFTGTHESVQRRVHTPKIAPGELSA